MNPLVRPVNHLYSGAQPAPKPVDGPVIVRDSRQAARPTLPDTDNAPVTRSDIDRLERQLHELLQAVQGISARLDRWVPAQD